MLCPLLVPDVYTLLQKCQLFEVGHGRSPRRVWIAFYYLHSRDGHVLISPGPEFIVVNHAQGQQLWQTSIVSQTLSGSVQSTSDLRCRMPQAVVNGIRVA